MSQTIKLKSNYEDKALRAAYVGNDFVATELVAEYLSKLEVEKPEIARVLKGLNYPSLAKELAEEALQELASLPELGINVERFATKDFNPRGRIFLGTIKNPSFNEGISISITPDGVLDFGAKVLAGVQRQRQRELDELSKYFKVAFETRASIFAVELLGYEVEVKKSFRNKKLIFHINAQEVRV